jgi:hypothetical protein
MELTYIYGEAQLTRALAKPGLNIVVHQKHNCEKSQLIHEYLTSLSMDDKYANIKVLIIDSHKLPIRYYQRRGIDRFPVVGYYHGPREINRVTGYHDLNMLVRGITNSRLRVMA